MAKEAASIDPIIKDIKSNKFHPIYFLTGEEPYYIDLLSGLIESHAIPEDQKEWNQVILYGKDIDILTLISNVKRFPMMGDKQLVIVREAQDIKYFSKEKEDKKKDDKSGDPFLAYVEKPLSSTILVICYKYKKFDMRTKLANAIKKNGLIYVSEKVYENKIPAWINQYLAEKSYKINQRATAMITEHLGNELGKIANELDKLIINVPASREITADDVDKYIGISKDFNVFELQNAIGNRDILKCNIICKYFAANIKNNPPFMIIAQLYSYFTKLLLIQTSSERSNDAIAAMLKVHPWFVKDYITASKNYSIKKLTEIISILREYDLKHKGVDSVNVDDGELLREMMYKILH